MLKTKRRGLSLSVILLVPTFLSIILISPFFLALIVPLRITLLSPFSYIAFIRNLLQHRERAEGAEEICNLIGRTTISTKQTLNFPDTKPSTKEYTWLQRIALLGINGRTGTWTYEGLIRCPSVGGWQFGEWRNIQ